MTDWFKVHKTDKIGKSDIITGNSSIIASSHNCIVTSLDCASFNLGLALLACGRDNDALVAYQQAGDKFPEAIDSHGLNDLVEAQKSWLSKERAEPYIQLLESLKTQLTNTTA